MLGKKTGGRPKGIPNKVKSGVAEMVAARGCNPFEVLADIAKGDLMCNVCRREGRTPYRGKEGKTHERKCSSCKGDGWEKISPAERAKAAAELCGYIATKLKAIELSGSVGTGDLAAVLRERYNKRQNGDNP